MHTEAGNAGRKPSCTIVLRTIFEIDGFGNNYERLDGCGKMGGYVGLYLGPG